MPRNSPDSNNTSPYKLIVIHKLLKVQLPASAITIKAKEGIANLIGTLSVELRASDLRHLAIVVDADTDNQARRPGAPKCGSSVS